jgi:hypothetical protein
MIGKKMRAQLIFFKHCATSAAHETKSSSCSTYKINDKPLR